MKRTLGWITIVFACVLVGVVFVNRVSVRDMIETFLRPRVPAPILYQDVVASKTPTQAVQEKTKTAEQTKLTPPTPVLEEEVNLSVPFTSQAPNGVWDTRAEEMCEEASLLMVKAYFEGEKNAVLDPETTRLDLQNMAAFEQELFGSYVDTSAEQTATIAEQYLGYPNSDLIENPTVDQIKQALSNGTPVLVPAAGRLLHNPYFTSPGPVYHMFVIRGYTKDGQFIVNDPGTKRGQAYVYPFETVMDAMHDWQPDQDITQGRKVVLILHPN